MQEQTNIYTSPNSLSKIFRTNFSYGQPDPNLL